MAFGDVPSEDAQSSSSTTVDLPAQGEHGEPPPKVRFSFGAETHRGKIRGNNEDHFLVARLAKSMEVCKSSLPDDGTRRFSEEEGYLMVVADGMGGAAAGERASALAVGSMEAFALNSLKWFLHRGGPEQGALFTELRQALERADRTIIERAQADLRLIGMGTTLTMAYSVGTDLFIAHAGDSRVYLLRDGELEQVTRDHTLVQLLVSAGRLTPEEAGRDKRRNIVTNVVGGPNEGVETEIHRLKIADGDRLLLCSDGLSEPLEDAAIAETLGATANPAEACDRLIQAALERGGPDNVTAIVARYDFR
jgi:serine/threonine protein phosphatase PrpC